MSHTNLNVSFYPLIFVKLSTWCCVCFSTSTTQLIHYLRSKLEVFYLLLSSGNACEVYDPYTGTVMTMVVGPPAHCPGAPVLAALPCQPLPLQPLEWAPPAPGPWCYTYNRKKRYSTDSQVSTLHLSLISIFTWDIKVTLTTKLKYLDRFEIVSL